MNNLYAQYQSKLIYSCLENFNVFDVMGAYAGGQFSVDNLVWWRASVDFLYRNIKSGLLEVDTCPDGLLVDDIDSLCRHYMEVGPDQKDMFGYVYFCASELLKELVLKHELMGWDYVNAGPNQNFIEDIKYIYSKANVGFDITLSRSYRSHDLGS